MPSGEVIIARRTRHRTSWPTGKIQRKGIGREMGAGGRAKLTLTLSVGCTEKKILENGKA